MSKKDEVAVIAVNPKDHGIEEKKAAQVQAVFAPMLAEMVELEDQYNEVIALADKEITDDVIEQARELRLAYRKTRTDTAAAHKEVKAFYLAGGRFVDAWKNTQKFTAQGKEEALEEIEKHYEKLEAERLVKLQEERVALLLPYKPDAAGTEWQYYENDIFTAILEKAQRDSEAAKLQAVEDEKAAKREKDKATEEAEKEVTTAKRAATTAKTTATKAKTAEKVQRTKAERLEAFVNYCLEKKLFKNQDTEALAVKALGSP